MRITFAEKTKKINVNKNRLWQNFEFFSLDERNRKRKLTWGSSDRQVRNGSTVAASHDSSSDDDDEFVAPSSNEMPMWYCTTHTRELKFRVSWRTCSSCSSEKSSLDRQRTRTLPPWKSGPQTIWYCSGSSATSVRQSSRNDFDTFESSKTSSAARYASRIDSTSPIIAAVASLLLSV